MKKKKKIKMSFTGFCRTSGSENGNKKRKTKQIH